MPYGICCADVCHECGAAEPYECECEDYCPECETGSPAFCHCGNLEHLEMHDDPESGPGAVAALDDDGTPLYNDGGGDIIRYYSYTPDLHFRRTDPENDVQGRYDDKRRLVERRRLRSGINGLFNPMSGDGANDAADHDPAITKPYPATTPLHMGVELEVSFGDMPFRDMLSRGREVLVQSRQADGDEFVYLKDDSSISGYGFECVTHPFTWDWSVKVADNPWRWVDYLEDEGALGDASCGMHVHLDRRAFTRTHMFRFLTFHYTNQDWLRLMCGRTEGNEHWGSFRRYDNLSMVNDGNTPTFRALVQQAKGPQWDETAGMVQRRMADRAADEAQQELERLRNTYRLRGVDIRGGAETQRRRTEWAGERGDAINTGNRATIELRYWAAPKTAEEFRTRLAFIDAVYHWTKDRCTASDAKKNPRVLMWTKFTDWLRTEQHEGSDQVMRYLMDNGLDSEPNALAV